VVLKRGFTVYRVSTELYNKVKSHIYKDFHLTTGTYISIYRISNVSYKGGHFYSVILSDDQYVCIKGYDKRFVLKVTMTIDH